MGYCALPSGLPKRLLLCVPWPAIARTSFAIVPLKIQHMQKALELMNVKLTRVVE